MSRSTEKRQRPFPIRWRRDPQGHRQGEAGPGERFPLVKEMAAVLGVNKNTVLRALPIGVDVKRLRELIEFCRLQGYRRTRSSK